MSRAYPTKNEARAYGDGYAQGGKDSRLLAQHEARALAFGAIRRAVAVARKWDAETADLAFRGFAQEAIGAQSTAHSVRTAIRAAIGSSKPTRDNGVWI